MSSLDTVGMVKAAFLLTELNNYKSTNRYWSQNNAVIFISTINADLEIGATLDMKLRKDHLYSSWQAAYGNTRR